MANILIIDDDIAATRLLHVLLDREGYRIQVENLGEKALEAGKAFSPDLIILDLMMPGTDGLEVCRQMKQDPQLGNVPVIMFSAVSDVDQRDEAFEAGVTDYITKPIHPDDLKQKIKHWLDEAGE